jgi:hypothetical protein
MSTMPTVEELHASSRKQNVLISDLRVDSSYQRDISERLVDEIAANFDPIAVETITVSDRGDRKDSEVEGGLFIVNGQHRAKAAQKKGIARVEARIIDLTEVADPARYEANFRLLTNKRIGDRPLERFKAQLRSGDEDSLKIVEILGRFGAEINLVSNSETGVNCVSTIEALYSQDSGSLLKDTLEVIKDTYGYVGGKFANADLLKAVCWFVEKHSGESDRDRLVNKLKGVGISVLQQRSRTMQLSMQGSLWINYYRTMIDLYNENLTQSKCLDWKLRGKAKIERGKFATS